MPRSCLILSPLPLYIFTKYVASSERRDTELLVSVVIGSPGDAATESNDSNVFLSRSGMTFQFGFQIDFIGATLFDLTGL